MAARYLTRDEAKVVREKKTTIIERELRKLHKKHKSITPDQIVKVAEDPKHPLHRFFEWDDSVAAKEYRKAQAMQMILASKFVVQLNEQQREKWKSFSKAMVVREFLPVHGRNQGFRMRNEVLSDDESRRAFVDRKIEMLASWCRSVIDIDELTHIREAIESVIARMSEQKTATG